MKHFSVALIIYLTLIPISGFASGTPGPPRSLCIVNTAVDFADGDNGPYTMSYEQFENSLWTAEDGGTLVTVFYPKERADRAPVMFFSHGFGGTEWTGYRSLIKHLATRGFIVVYSPYPSSGMDIPGRYDIMWNGFLLATQRYTSRMDLQKVGFLGHSFGAGAVPAMAWKGLVEQGWGSQGALLFILAPWYSYHITDTQLKTFPKQANLIVQVYNEDAINDHRMAIDLFTNIAVPDSQKAYYNIVSGNVAPAGHTVPSDREINDLDTYAVRTPLDALLDYAFKLDSQVCDAKSYGFFGYGSHFQHTVTNSPQPVASESTYEWAWSSYANPRK